MSDTPIYISEVKEKFMNPDFQHFDLSRNTSLTEHLSCLREDTVAVRVWAVARESGPNILLIEAEVHLPSLIRIGKTVRSNTIRARFADY